ncbi:MAG: hypothetical protein CMC86_08030 [Flavobacteriaceae bacterium]|jgi:hypothetical protein|nr:hypothetical protein [Flavobacteriaceae bacterium]
MKKSLNTTLVYVLSILGLLCCCVGGLGLFLSGPAYLIANKKIKNAEENPDNYEGSVSAMSTAKTVALVILIINVIYLFYTIYVVTTGDFSEFQKEFEKAMEEMNQST